MANNGSYSFGNDTYFDSIYCINLKDRPDRWSQVKIELEKIGILDRVIRFDAVKNQNPAIGCYLSHCAIIEEAKSKGYKKILVLEDDIRLIRNQSEFYLGIEKLKNFGNWDLFYFGGEFGNMGKILKRHGGLYQIQGIMCTYAIGYNEHIYDVILDYRKKMHSINQSYGFDVWLARELQPRIVSLMPLWPCLTQNGSYSDIRKKMRRGSYLYEQLHFILVKYKLTFLFRLKFFKEKAS